jgi:hypothetical protein
MKFSVPIPKELAHLKLDDRGYPIPFFAPIRDGKPDFKVLSMQKQKICIEEKICSICGKKLYKDVMYFITGPYGLYNRAVVDPAMHLICAEFALKACPHMFYERAERNKITAAGLSVNQAKEKSEVMILIKCKKYEKDEKTEPGKTYIRFTVISWQQYIYVDGRLQADLSEKGRGGPNYELPADAILKRLNNKNRTGL